MTTALYRRYRPESFAEVIGQDHVTAPLRQALRSDQANHAYLFSGPRGCGKTTSARILARCLNCAQGPTDTPCGVCASCVELARGGSGSLDVVEIDAASHGGVDDARELRERATFAPARDRYKIFILDEAHMVSPQGFNALLKIVEEPPPHVKFIFATTEPDKVIGTIRSRTHHYPFRLVPPDVLVPYLEHLCATEDVTVGSGVLPLVVRSGGGSVRDTLSVLDQLIAGAGDGGLEYEGAVALLGYTHGSLLDDLVDAIAARDGASAFRVVERVIATGHEPRRFVEDLLERLRDLIVISAAGEAAGAVLRDVPADQLDRMRRQATHLGASELSRSADLANAALTEMVGATSPRLHLELLMARLLLPSVDDSRTGLGARLDRLERGLPAPERALPAVEHGQPTVVRAGVELPPVAGPAAPPVVAPVAPPVAAAAPAPVPPVDEPVRPGDEAPVADDHATAAVDAEAPVEVPAPDETAPSEEPLSSDEPVPSDETPTSDETAVSPAAPVEPERPAAPAPAPAAAAPAAPASPAAPAPGAVAAAADTEMLRRRWPDVLTTLRRLRLPSWALVNQHAQILELDATTLRLGFAQPGLVTTFRNSNHGEVVARALSETLGVTARVEAVLDEPGGTRPVAADPDVPQVPTTISPERAAASWGDPAPASASSGARPGAPDGDPRGGRPAPGARQASGAASTAPAPVPSTGRTTPAPGAGQGPTGEPTAAAADGPASGATADRGPGRPVAPWEPLDDAPTDAPAHGAATGAAASGSTATGSTATGAGASGARASAGAASGSGRTGAPGGPGTESVVAHPDDDIPLGDEPDDPWRDGPPRATGPAAPRGGPAQGRPGGAAGGPRPSAAASPAGGAAPASTAPGGSASGGSAVGGTARERGVAAARAAAAQSRGRAQEPDEPSPDDPTIGQSSLVGVPLVAQVLGGRVIDEQVDI